jgi:hypothetical protein
VKEVEGYESGAVHDDALRVHLEERHGPSEVLEVSDGTYLVLAQASGKLILCDKCVRWEWDCRTTETGSTWCTKKCTDWECREVPASFTRALVRALA